MRIKIGFLAIGICTVLILRPCDHMEANAAQDKFKVLVQIVATKDFKRVYKDEYSKESYEGSTIVYSLQEDLADYLEKRLSSDSSGGAWEAVICENSKEFEENAGDTAAFLTMRVEITEYKSTYKRSSSNYRSYYELTVNCHVHRRNGPVWSKIFSKELTSKSTRSTDDEYFVSSVEKMADTLNTVLINHMVSYEIMNSMAKDTKTKVIKAKVLNPSPFAIRKLTWIVPAEKENIRETIEGLIKPGEVVEVSITVRSESSHAAIGWRNAYISKIVFDPSAE